jgi:hypothetical protein
MGRLVQKPLADPEAQKVREAARFRVREWRAKKKRDAVFDSSKLREEYNVMDGEVAHNVWNQNARKKVDMSKLFVSFCSSSFLILVFLFLSNMIFC